MTIERLRAGGGVGIVLGLWAGSLGFAAAQVPANSCMNAPFVTVPGAYQGSTVGATADGTASCGTSGSTPDVWVKHTAARTAILWADTCAVTDFDSIVSVRAGCAGAEVACNDDSCGITSRLSCRVEAGETYWVRVSGFSGEIGPFRLTLAYADLPADPNPGPDIVVGEITEVRYWSRAGNTIAYSVGATVCNIGDTGATWQPDTNQHAVIAQSMFRLKHGRIEQIGQSWLRHTTTAANDGSCGICAPAQSGILGVGCSDPYGAGLSGEQSALGPKWQVHASSADFPFPPASPPVASPIDRRLQVLSNDIEPELNQGAAYFVEALLASPDDARADRAMNNASCRQINFGMLDSDPAMAGATLSQRPAISAWKNADPAVTELNLDFTENGNSARFIVACKSTEVGTGVWRYEYAVYNQNSDRAAGRFAVPLPSSASVFQVGFHDVDYHSGDGDDNINFHDTDWYSIRTDGTLLWETDPFEDKPNSNALRWGTMYNFWFDADVPPTSGRAIVGLFRPGTPGEPAQLSAMDVPVPRCPADWLPDGFINSQDFFNFISDLFDGSADFNNDTFIDSQDFFDFLRAFFHGC